MVVLLQVLAVLAVVFGVAVVLTGRADTMSEERQDLADTGIPRDRAMTPQDVVGLRFALAFRGYRMAEVDDALDRLAAELAARDEAIARLRAERTVDEYVPSDATGDVPGGPPPGWEMPPVPDAGEPDGYEPAFRAPEPEPEPEPEPVAEPAPEPQPEPETAPEPEPQPEPDERPVGAAAAAAAFGAPEPGAPNPFRPEVPDIPTYDPWAVTPRSRYTDGPEYVEVDEHDDEHVAESVTEHQTGYAPPPPAVADDTDDEDDEDEDERPKPPWQS